MRSPARRNTTLMACSSIACLLMAGCAGLTAKSDLPVVPAVDLARYAGTWYEIARLPMWFQRHCVDSKAVYSRRADGSLAVRSECVTDSGTTESADGIATVVDAKTNARLAVMFDNWFARFARPSREGNYWILDLDDAYRTALVGTPDRQYLWILSRSPQLESATFQRLVEKGRELGFPVDKLIRDRRVSS